MRAPLRLLASVRASLALTALAAAPLVGCAPTPAPGEGTADTCSNGRDDDGDGLTDCADPACGIYVFCVVGSDAGRADAGPLDGAAPDAAACQAPLDVVLSVDVSSSTVDAVAALRDRAPSLVEGLRAIDPTAQVSLVVFVDDALAVEGCAPFATGAALADELERWRVLAPTNRSPVSGTVNQDCAENGLDALAAVAACSFREGSTRIALHVTDDTFAENPTVLSGPFGGGVLVQRTYAQTVAALRTAGVRVMSFTETGVGAPCGAGRSPDVGQGFTGPYAGAVALPDATGGVGLPLAGLVDGSIDVAARVREVAARACP